MGRVWRLELATRKTVQVFRLYTFVMSLKCSALAKTHSLNSIILLSFITTLTHWFFSLARDSEGLRFVCRLKKRFGNEIKGKSKVKFSL